MIKRAVVPMTGSAAALSGHSGRRRTLVKCKCAIRRSFWVKAIHQYVVSAGLSCAALKPDSVCLEVVCPNWATCRSSSPSGSSYEQCGVNSRVARLREVRTRSQRLMKTFVRSTIGETSVAGSQQREPRRGGISTVVAGLIVFLVEGCDATGSDAGRRQNVQPPVNSIVRLSAEPELDQCVRLMTPALAARNARADIARAEFRFYWVFESEGDLWNPPGLKDCTPRTGVMRRDKVNRFDGAPIESAREAQCAIAIYDYKTRYNWTMATIHQDSLHASCSEATSSIDKHYRRKTASEYDSFVASVRLK